MEHAEAHERLSDLALEPAKLRSLRALAGTDADANPDAIDGLDELRTHLAGCDRCTDDLDDWLRTWSAMGEARRATRAGTADPDDRHVLAPPNRLRARTLAAIRSPEPAPVAQAEPIARAPRGLQFGGRGVRMLLAAAAVLAVAFVGVGVVAIQSRIELGQEQSQQAALSSTAAALDRVLAAPSHQLLPLHAADGSPSGTLAWSDSEFVVLTSTLNPPAAGQEYRCWINVDGQRTVLGSLAFTDRVASWNGSMSGWQWDFVPGAQFGVSLYRGDGTSAAPVLVATFPSR